MFFKTVEVIKTRHDAEKHPTEAHQFFYGDEEPYYIEIQEPDWSSAVIHGIVGGLIVGGLIADEIIPVRPITVQPNAPLFWMDQPRYLQTFDIVAEPGFINARMEFLNEQLQLAHDYFEEKFYDRETKVKFNLDIQ